MPNVIGSTGKFGTSMDYSMLLRLKKQNLLTAEYRMSAAPGNPVFNRDKKTSGFDNGVVDVFFQKGLFLAIDRQLGAQLSNRTILTLLYDDQGDRDYSTFSQAQITLFGKFEEYVEALLQYINIPIGLIELEALAVELQAYVPYTLTYNINIGNITTVVYDIVGNVQTDLAAVAAVGGRGKGINVSTIAAYTDRSGGGGGTTYPTTAVTDNVFSSDEATFYRTLVSSSQISYAYDGGNSVPRSFHYFNLNNLDTDYNYTFEITAADLGLVGTQTETDTIILLFNSQTQPINNANLVADNDDIDSLSVLSKLENQPITGNWCLAVTSNAGNKTGSFTLKITRTLASAPGNSTAVTDADFTNDEVTFNKTLEASSQLSYQYNSQTRTRSFHYFNLTGLDMTYIYTFETTSADFSGGDGDTVILLFNTQTRPTSGTLLADNDEFDQNSNLSKLEDQTIGGNWCLAVTSFAANKTGLFTLKITRASVSTTNVTNSSFSGDEVIFNRRLDASSFISYTYFATRTRAFHYFNLNNLDTAYVYTFETTAANLNGNNLGNTVIVLFDTQTQPTNGTVIALNDQGNTVNNLSKLVNQPITGNWCLAVTTVPAEVTGPFTLKITRTLV